MPIPAMQHVCRNCGADIFFPADGASLICPFCDQMNSRPVSTGACLDYLQRAGKLRLAREFDEATACYNHVLNEHPDEHEALWGRVLSLYGVEHLTVSGREQIVVHKPQGRPLQEQRDYLSSCEYAPEDVRVQYQAEALYIDQVQHSIHDLTRTAQPWDVAILCENAPEEMALARRIQQELQGECRVCIPLSELRSGSEAQQEAALYHALSTAPVMLALATQADRLTTPLVESAWQRCLEWTDGMHGKQEAGKHLIPVCAGNVALPDAFTRRALKAVDITREDALGDLCQRVADLVSKARPAQMDAPRTDKATAADFMWSRQGKEVRIDLYTGHAAKVAVPARIDGSPVTVIGAGAFEECAHVTTIALPEGVTTIGEDAFAVCTALTSVTLPDSIAAIGAGAFWDCERLAGVSIPRSMKEIEAAVFHGCTALSGVVVPRGVAFISGNAFEGCPHVTIRAEKGSYAAQYARDHKLPMTT